MFRRPIQRNQRGAQASEVNFKRQTFNCVLDLLVTLRRGKVMWLTTNWFMTYVVTCYTVVMQFWIVVIVTVCWEWKSRNCRKILRQQTRLLREVMAFKNLQLFKCSIAFKKLNHYSESIFQMMSISTLEMLLKKSLSHWPNWFTKLSPYFLWSN